ncbi:AMP-binding protein [Halobacillus shinanisalinarum]|uniref:AMP-binding protein n=1 Tax=Halobacillus shinanisalinarum TaxID=2932258 RepID=A0ABY4H534_9BACI|nr:AMP-binding protein [Halobacillus shinanisalinarum]UOQ95416.1 AMP-binding protein [Halobacillus shinanisalinarum]
MAFIGPFIKEIAEQSPKRIAIETNKDRITYQEFYHSVLLLQRKISRLLPEGKGKKIGFLLPNEPKWLELFIAISSSGGIAIPFDPKWSPFQLNDVIKDSQPDLVIYDGVFADRFRNTTFVQTCTIDALDLLFPSEQSRNLFLDQEPFYIGYTSGTTGQPKGFIRIHASWADCFSLGRQVFSLDKEDHILCPGPLVHSHFLYAAVQCLHIGATLHLCSSFDAREVSEVLRRKNITVMYIVPTMFEALNKIGCGLISEHLRTLISSGAKWSAASKQAASQAFPHASIYEFYGASELSFVSFREVNDGGLPEGAIGEPFPRVEILILSDDGRPVRQGEVGNLFVRSPWIFDGYLNRPEETADVFNGAWATVGDLAFVDGDEHVILKGRKKNMIISGGLNIYPEEVEQVIREHPAIDEAVVKGVENDYWGEKVTAFVTRTEGKQLFIDDVKDHLTKLLPKYKCPKEWIELDEFPYTNSGKIARKELVEPAGRN